MMAPVNNSRIFTPYVPSLLHFATVKMAVLFLNDFDFATLRRAFRSIQEGKTIQMHKNCKDPMSTSSKEFINLNSTLITQEGASKKMKFENSGKDPLIIKDSERYPDLMGSISAQERLLLIPPHLREIVMKAVRGMQYGARRWKMDHSDILDLKEGDFALYWKSDGTFDGIKTAQHLVQNVNIEIRKRFDLACMHCLKESIQTLWAEMEESGKTERFKVGDNFLVCFWVRWMRNGSRDPWEQAALEFFKYPRYYRRAPKFSAFFPSLRPEERKELLDCFNCVSTDDLRLCMYAMTEVEEEKTLLNVKWCPCDLLCSYLKWPLQNCFLETSEKMLNYIDASSFIYLLKHILHITNYFDDFEYSKLFEDFWNQSPGYLRETALQNPNMRKRLDSWLNKIRRERNAHLDGIWNEEKYLFEKQMEG